jgi:hypothetical protein
MAAPSSSSFLLVVERGQTRFPQRPIIADRFLIGAGSNCQLQLGGTIPFLHSIIVPEGDHLWIDAVVADPPLLVNGQQIREGELRRGDVLEIGSFVFSIDARPPAATASPRPEPESLTAVQLVDGIHSELERLSQFVDKREQAAKALIDAVTRAPAAGQSPRESPPLRKTA